MVVAPPYAQALLRAVRCQVHRLRVPPTLAANEEAVLLTPCVVTVLHHRHAVLRVPTAPRLPSPPPPPPRLLLRLLLRPPPPPQLTVGSWLPTQLGGGALLVPREETEEARWAATRGVQPPPPPPPSSGRACGDRGRRQSPWRRLRARLRPTASGPTATHQASGVRQ